MQMKGTGCGNYVRDKGVTGVRQSENFANVIFGSPLIRSFPLFPQKMKSLSFSISFSHIEGQLGLDSCGNTLWCIFVYL